MVSDVIKEQKRAPDTSCEDHKRVYYYACEFPTWRSLSIVVPWENSYDYGSLC